MKSGQAVRAYGPESHLVKTGTPTMGGALILIAVAISTLLWADWTNRFVWVVLLVTFGFGSIGWMDDYRKVVYRDPAGMPERPKIGRASGRERVAQSVEDLVADRPLKKK